MTTVNDDSETCPNSPHGKHEYETAHEDWESETRQCKYCDDRYKLYDDEMR